MKKIAKRFLAFLFVVLLICTTVSPAFAAGSRYAMTSTYSVYRPSTSSGTQMVYVPLAYSDDDSSAYMKRSDISISNNSCGATLVGLNRSAYVFLDQEETDGGTDTDGFMNNSYNAMVRVKNSGSCTINFKVDGKSYTRTLRVLAYQNPIKSLTMKGIYGDKDFVSLTKTSATASSTIKVSANKSNVLLKATPASGWRFSSIDCRDLTKGMRQTQTGGTEGYTAGYLKIPVIRNDRNYIVTVSLYNTNTGASITITYRLNGSNVNGRSFNGSLANALTR